MVQGRFSRPYGMIERFTGSPLPSLRLIEDRDPVLAVEKIGCSECNCRESL